MDLKSSVGSGILKINCSIGNYRFNCTQMKLFRQYVLVQDLMTMAL